jgi:hypothetical protein
MSNIRFDHFLAYTSAASIDDYLREYAAQGFIPEERTVRHDPGLRNGFVFVGPEYLEFLWVEDEALFAAAEEEDRLARAAPRPFGIGLITDDIHALHEDWAAHGYSVPEVSSKAARDAAPDAPPAWSFQEVPGELLPGAFCFALTYHARPRDAVRQIRIAPNTIYAVCGVTFVAAGPKERATHWRDLLAPEQPVSRSESGFAIWIGPHQATWLTPKAYEAAYGLPWAPASHSAGELAHLHLLASDLRRAKRMMEQAGRQPTPIVASGEERLLVAPDPRDGFAFVIQQQPVELWLQERMVRTGEKLELAQE